MTKSEFINHISDEYQGQFSKRALNDIVETVFDAMADVLLNGDEIRIPEFGTFKVKERAARVGHNPQTGAKIEIPACKVATFKQAKALKELLNA